MNKLPKLSVWFVRRPIITALMVLFALLGITYYITQEYYQLQLRNASREAENIMLSAEKSIQQTIDVSHLVALKASLTINDDGQLDDFDSVAHSLIERYPIVSIIQMVPGGVITHCYPLEGNESVIGYDILADSLVSREAYRAIERNEMYFAGPLELKQGGMAVIGRIPVFRQNEFWGFSAVIIMLNDLLTNATALADDYNKYRLDFSKVNPNTNQEEFFLKTERFESETVFESTFLFAGEWTIYLYTDNTKNAIAMSVPVAMTGTICSFLFAVVFGSILFKSKQQYKEVVRLAEEKIYTFLNRISDGFVSLDSNWNYTYANENAGKSSDLTSEDLVGNNIWKLFPHLVDQPIYTAYNEAMKTQKFMYFEDYYEPFDTHFEHFIYPSKDGLSVFYRDVTEKKRKEKLYFLAEQKLANHLNQSPLAVIEWDANSKVIQWSSKAQEIFGYTAEECKGKSLYNLNLVHPDDLNDVEEVRKELEGEKKGNQSFNRNITKSGEVIHCQWFNSVIHNSAGEVISIMSLVQNVTSAYISEQKLIKSEIELTEINNRLRKLSAHLQSVREEERSNIAREIHDELGNQLTGLKLDLSMLQSELSESDATTVLVSKVEQMSEKVSETISAVRKISSDLRPSILDDLGLVTALKWYAEQFEKRFNITCQMDLNELQTNLSKEANTAVFRIFQESLTNVMRHAQASIVRVKLFESDDSLIMQLTDDGIGISDKRKYNSSSLGLLGMAERAAMLNGTFNIENNSGEGTTVTISIPLAENDIVVRN